MSLKILLADDNLTAQRLGTKILTDAGHEVIAVSNGAAAVKKIASDKPDFLILDVYMPGYTGLEVCEKVKGDPGSEATPVLLTMTDMEPPVTPQDVARVRADGIMTKPFVGTDLLAVVAKFEKKAAAQSAKQADYSKTVKMEAIHEFNDDFEEWKGDEEEEETPKKVEVPQEMASAPAFGIDEEPAAAFTAPAPSAFTVDTAPTPAFESQEQAAPEAFAMDAAAAPAFDLAPPAGPSHSFDLAPAAADAAPDLSAPASPALEWGSPAESAAVNPLQEAASIFEPSPVIDSAPAEMAPAPGLEYTSVAPVEVAIQTAPELETAAATPDLPIAQDPALATNAEEISQFATKFGEEHPEEIPVGIATPAVEAAPQEYSGTGTERIEAVQEIAEAAAEPHLSEPEPAPASAPASPLEQEMQRAFAVNSAGAAVAPAAIVEAAPVAEAPAPSHDELVAQFAAELEQAQTAAPEPGVEPSMEMMAPPAPAAIDEERVAEAVTRVLDHYIGGLRAELVAAIIRELKS